MKKKFLIEKMGLGQVEKGFSSFYVNFIFENNEGQLALKS